MNSNINLPDESPSFNFQKHKEANALPSGISLLIWSAGSTLFYLLAAFLIIYFFHERQEWGTWLLAGYPLRVHFIAGIISGTILALVVWLLMAKTTISEIWQDYLIIRLLTQMRTSIFSRIHLSAGAGIGEEALFRGALQPLLGIGLTSLLFVGLHGYIRFDSWRHIVFAITMLSLSVFLGILFKHVGLMAAMIAHSLYDLIMLGVVKKS